MPTFFPHDPRTPAAKANESYVKAVRDARIRLAAIEAQDFYCDVAFWTDRLAKVLATPDVSHNVDQARTALAEAMAGLEEWLTLLVKLTKS